MRILSLLIIQLACLSSVFAQVKINYPASTYLAIPDTYSVIHHMDTLTFGGISGITQGNEPNVYYLINDKQEPVAGFFKATITVHENEINFRIKNFIAFPTDNIEGEAIRTIPNDNNSLIICSENDLNTDIYINPQSINPIKINKLSEYSENMQWNNGYEGLAVDGMQGIFYASLEKPLLPPEELHYDPKTQYICPILKTNINHPHDIKKIYGYPLQRKKPDNGISELLLTSDSTLLVCERAWLKKEHRNIVRLFAVNLNNTVKINNGINIHQIEEMLKPHIKLNFDRDLQLGTHIVSPGNIEGMCFSHDKKYLILITDNNYGNRNHTPTEIYMLRLDD